MNKKLQKSLINEISIRIKILLKVFLDFVLFFLWMLLKKFFIEFIPSWIKVKIEPDTMDIKIAIFLMTWGTLFFIFVYIIFDSIKIVKDFYKEIGLNNNA